MASPSKSEHADDAPVPIRLTGAAKAIITFLVTVTIGLLVWAADKMQTADDVATQERESMRAAIVETREILKEEMQATREQILPRLAASDTRIQHMAESVAQLVANLDKFVTRAEFTTLVERVRRVEDR